MKHIYLNLKRFDIPVKLGGVNSLASPRDWARLIISQTQPPLAGMKLEDVDITMFFPEAHILNAVSSLCQDSPIKIGCQGVFREDTSVNGNFGAFTTNRTANSARALGCSSVIIGHCEERSDKAGIIDAGGGDVSSVDKILNREIKAARKAGLDVLYCIGEKTDEHSQWKRVLKKQLEEGLDGISGGVTIAYEPVWAIGPGKTPPGRDYIAQAASYIKEVTGNLDVVYGGGLKAQNARMLSSINELDGGLVALTRFSGDVGFYPAEYLEIIRLYLGVD